MSNEQGTGTDYTLETRDSALGTRKETKKTRVKREKLKMKKHTNDDGSWLMGGTTWYVTM